VGRHTRSFGETGQRKTPSLDRHTRDQKSKNSVKFIGKQSPCCDLGTNSPTKVPTTPKFGFSNPAQVLATMAHASERENPNKTAENTAPRVPIRRVDFLPILSLIRAHWGAMMNSPKVKTETMRPA